MPTKREKVWRAYLKRQYKRVIFPKDWYNPRRVKARAFENLYRNREEMGDTRIWTEYHKGFIEICLSKFK